MDKKELSFSVQMTAKEIFLFMMYHSYCKLSGVIGLLLSLFAIVSLVTSYTDMTDQNKAVYVIVALWFTVLEPVTMLSRARSQAKKNPVYKKPLTYEVNSEGITVSQDEERQSIEWSRLLKVVETKSQYLVYSNKINAFIFPKNAIGQECSVFEQLVYEYTKGTGVKIPSRMKKD